LLEIREIIEQGSFQLSLAKSKACVDLDASWSALIGSHSIGTDRL